MSFDEGEVKGGREGGKERRKEVERRRRRMEIASVRGVGLNWQRVKIRRTEMRLKRARVPYHSNMAGRGSRAVGGQWTTRSTDCCNRSFVASWSASGERERLSEVSEGVSDDDLADRVGEKKNHTKRAQECHLTGSRERKWILR